MPVRRSKSWSFPTAAYGCAMRVGPSPLEVWPESAVREDEFRQ